ncbi:hypothetical protein JCM8547_004644 [Rhodosporidiobolus lusitaniae]
MYSSFLPTAAIALLGLASRAFAASKTLDVNFADFTGTEWSEVEPWLNEQGLSVSDWPVDDATKSYTYSPKNVDIHGGVLRLKVTAGEDVVGGEVTSQDEDILYGTFTAIAKGSKVPGVCQGIFIWGSDYNEVDIELLSSYYDASMDTDLILPGLQFTNRPVVEDTPETNNATAYASGGEVFDPTDDFHEYQFVWSKTQTSFYLDGELKQTFKTNVPEGPAQFFLNNWSNGDVHWSAGPPTEDSYFLVKSIHLGALVFVPLSLVRIG